MADPLVHGNRRTLSASDMLNALGDALSQIRHEDRLTWADLGSVMRKSDDQAAKYADSSATMDVVAFALAKREWGSRFAGPFERLIEQFAAAVNDRQTESIVLMAALCLSQSLADDNAITAAEIRANRSVLERARDAIERQLAKVGPEK